MAAQIAFDFDAPNGGEGLRCCAATAGRILRLEPCPDEAYCVL